MKQASLTYKRDGLFYAGRILFDTEEYSFDNMTFAQMIGELHTFLAEHPDVDDVAFCREERPGFPARLENNMVGLIRSDPVTAIREMSPPARVVDMRAARKKIQERFDQDLLDTEPVPPAMTTMPSSGGALRAASATLADAFGEFIYLNRRGNTVECPFCGRWKCIIACTAPTGHCSCKRFIPGRVIERAGQETGWFRVRTTCILANHLDRFFLPMTWNINGPWIDHEDLLDAYRKYVEEREQCLEMVNRSDLPE